MDRSMISMIYFVALLALFLIMIIATIAVIASKSKRRYDDEDEFEDGTEYEDAEQPEDEQTVFDDADAMLSDDFYVDNLDMPGGDSALAQDEAGYDDEYEDEYAEDGGYDADTDEGDYEEVDAADVDDSYEDYENVEVDDYDAELDSAFDVPGSLQIDHEQANAPTQEIDTKAVKEERWNSMQEKETPVEDADVIPEIETELETPVEDADIDITETSETEHIEEAMSDVYGEPEDEESNFAEPEEITDSSELENITETSELIEKCVPTEQEPESVTTTEEPAETEMPVESPKKQKKKHVRKQKKQPEAVAEPKPEASKEDFSDSAFGPDIPEINISNEALAASVREAEAMGAAIMGDLKAAKVPVETMFGINEELSSYGSKKNKRAKSKVASDEDFYWYNKEDAADRPARRPIEAYYHHFNIADDCIEDLLVEMYDCALVRTEEIRYIAYGIEPRTLTMKEIMSGTVSLNDHKKKEPTEQDLVRIYEKWCGYVDHLLDKVEIHADEYTIQEIRKQLCAYGRNDVDTLLEGK